MRTVPMATRLPRPRPRSPALTHGAHRPAQRRAGPDRGHSEPAALGRAQGWGQRCGAESSGAARYNRPPPALPPLAALRPAPHTGSSHWPGAAGALGCCSSPPWRAGYSRHALRGGTSSGGSGGAHRGTGEGRDGQYSTVQYNTIQYRAPLGPAPGHSLCLVGPWPQRFLPAR